MHMAYKLRVNATTQEGVSYYVNIVVGDALGELLSVVRSTAKEADISILRLNKKALLYIEPTATTVGKKVPIHESDAVLNALTLIQSLSTELTWEASSKITKVSENMLTAFNMSITYLPYALSLHAKGYDLKKIRTNIYKQLVAQFINTVNEDTLEDIKDIKQPLLDLSIQANTFNFPTNYVLPDVQFCLNAEVTAVK